jgi:Tol biopolymer transport system component/ubiquinone/menaquinone biosynthesis C-methylase UbiE
MPLPYSEALVLRVNELFYDLANGQYEDIHTEMIGGERQRWRKNITTYLRLEEPITLADLGSGAGLVAITIGDLLRAEDTFICADLSGGMLEVARANILAEPRRPRFEFRKIEGETPIRLPFEDASLDAVTMNSVLHHIKDTDGYMHEIERVLKPGGLFFVAHEPNRHFVRHPLLRLNYGITKLILLPRHTAMNVLKRTGLYGIAARTYYRFNLEKKGRAEALIGTINRTLRSEGLITEDLTLDELGGITDIRDSEGFEPEKLWPHSELLHLETYNHMLLVSIKHAGRNMVSRYEGFLRRRFPGKGATFFAVFRKLLLMLMISLPLLTGCSSLTLPEERAHISNLRQLTFGGENAEGYFSFDETRFVYQRTHPDGGDKCDQIYLYDLRTGYERRISTGYGRTTCSYFLPGDSLVLYASTHLGDSACPPPPDLSHGYTWALFPNYDIFVADTTGHIVRRLTNSPGYDAEATVSPLGDKIIFTSTRTGDIELFSMKLDGSDVRQLTNIPGYDGGAFYSWDGKKIVFRASRPTEKELEPYRKLLGQGLVRPSRMELQVMDADGGNLRQITNNGAANFGPFWHPDNKHIIFASNMDDPKGRNFDLYIIREDGTGLRRITWNESFDGFPMFTRDGRRLIFASNRNGAKPGDTNLFLCDFELGD